MSYDIVMSILHQAVYQAVPVALAALGVIFCQRCGVFNIGLEGMMLMGAFGASAGLVWFGGNHFAAIGFAMLFSCIMSLLFAFAVLVLKANSIVVSLAINLLGLGLSSFLIKVFFNSTGGNVSPEFTKVGTISIPLLEKIPVLNMLFSGQDYMVYVTIGLVIITAILLYKTHFGLAVRAIGESPETASSAGIKTDRVKLISIIWCGALCGLAGADMSTVILSQFTENMVSGRGYTAFSAVVFGGADPLATWLVSLLLGVADAIGLKIDILNIGIPSYIVKCFPYLMALIALSVSSLIFTKKRAAGKKISKPKEKAKKAQ